MKQITKLNVKRVSHEKKTDCSQHPSSRVMSASPATHTHTHFPIIYHRCLRFLCELRDTKSRQSVSREVTCSIRMFVCLLVWLCTGLVAQQRVHGDCILPLNKRVSRPLCVKSHCLRSFVWDNEPFCSRCFCHRSSLSCDSVHLSAIHHSEETLPNNSYLVSLLSQTVAQM